MCVRVCVRARVCDLNPFWTRWQKSVFDLSSPSTPPPSSAKVGTGKEIFCFVSVDDFIA